MRITLRDGKTGRPTKATRYIEGYFNGLFTELVWYFPETDILEVLTTAQAFEVLEIQQDITGKVPTINYIGEL